MTPDKIYVHVRTEPRPSITFSEALEKNSTNEEYIRKDALLEKCLRISIGTTEQMKRVLACMDEYFAQK